MRRWSNLDVGTLLGRLTSFSVRRARLVVAAVVVISLVAAALALRLDASASPSTFVDHDGAAAQATDDLHRKFGDEPIVILVRGQLTGMLLTQDVGRMLSLEGCISGNQPRNARTPARVCREFAQKRPIQVVYGPGTFINEAAGQVLDQINYDPSRQEAEADRAARAARRVAVARGLPRSEQDRLADAARAVVSAKYSQRALELAVRYGLSSAPALNNPDFVLRLVFEPSLGAETPKPRFAYLFPGPGAALIQARLRPGLSDAERRDAIAMVREAVAGKSFDLQFGTYVVSGVPVVAEGVEESIADEVPVLLGVAVLVMALTLLLVFRARRTLLPLALALAAAALTFGAMSVAGADLTIAALAVLPVLVGLAVNYAIQFQARFEEEGRDAVRATRAGGPVIATAGAATAAGFLALLLSPVPMVRGFGALLAVGVVLAFLVTLTAGVAVLSRPLRARNIRRPVRGRVLSRRIPFRFGGLTGRARGVPPARWAASFLKFVRDGARGLVAEAKLVPPLFKRLGRWALGVSVARPRRVLGVAALIAVSGWVAWTQVEVVSDVARLAPADLREVRDLKTLQREAGTSGDVNVLVRSERLLDPEVVGWMTRYQSEVLRRHGFSEKRPCSRAELCPALSLTNLFGSGRQSARQVEQVIEALPRYFSQNVITADRRTANIAFRVRTMPLDKQKELVDDMRAQLDPPRGVQAELAGLPVLVADAHGKLETSRWWLSLAALGAVFLVLLVAYRRLAAAAVPLVPVALATGWSFLLVFALQIPLNPLSAALGALVIAIAAEFAVILSARYRAGRARGLEPVAALSHTYARTGAAILACGLTAIAGFAVLLISDFPMLRDFGAVTVVSLSASLLGTMVALPAALVWAEQRGPLRIPRSRADLAALGRSAGRALRAGAHAAPRPCVAPRPRCAGLRAPCAAPYHHASNGRRPRSLLRGRPEGARGRAGPRRGAPVFDRGGNPVPRHHPVRRVQRAFERQPGPTGLQEGRRLPAFAAPSATGSLEGDSNVDQKEACKIQVRDAIRICDYFDRPLVLVAWFSKCGGHCEPVLNAVERIRRRFPDVAFVGVDIRNSPDEARDAVEENGWGFPMAVDRDGAVGLLYSVGVGPTIFFAYPRGVLAAKALGELTEEELIDRVERLQRTSRKRQNGARINNPE